MKQPLNNPRGQRVIMSLVLAAVLAAVLYAALPQAATQPREVPLSELQQMYTADQLQSITIDGEEITALGKDGSKLLAYRLQADNTADLGFATGKAELTIVPQEQGALLRGFLVNVLPLLILAILAVVVLRGMRGGPGGQGGPFSFGQSKARMYLQGNGRTTFADVAGNKEAKEDLVEIVDFLKTPKKYAKMGAKIPKGVLLYGPPGTGKTLIAKAVAGEAGVPFFSISGSEFVEMFVGVGASRVRDLFAKAKKAAPAIIFVDEIDAVGRQRGAGLGGGNDEREQTLNQILTEMDGFEDDAGVIVMAATNRPDVLDPALMRPGRFDRRVHVELPDAEARQEILRVHARNKPFASDINYTAVAKKTVGMTGADLANVMNEAAILATKEKAKEIAEEHIHKSIEKLILGPERQTKVFTEEQRRVTAYHEVGHALVAHYLPQTDPVHKISIISRGRALGVTWFLPDEDQYMLGATKLMQEMAATLGGRAAEEIVFGEITTGASNDIQQVTNKARRMVMEWGMSPELGLVTYSEGGGNVFLGRDIMDSRNHSDETARAIDKAVQELSNRAYELAKQILRDHRAELDKVSLALLEKEVLTDAELEELVGPKNGRAPREKAAAPAAVAAAVAAAGGGTAGEPTADAPAKKPVRKPKADGNA